MSISYTLLTRNHADTAPLKVAIHGAAAIPRVGDLIELGPHKRLLEVMEVQHLVSCGEIDGTTGSGYEIVVRAINLQIAKSKSS